MGYSLVTGASSGIGLELCHLLAKDGCNLVLIARKEKELYQLKNDLEDKYSIKAHVIVSDLQCIDAPLYIYNEIANLNIEIDNLINNAGFGSFGPFCEIDSQKDLAMLDVNCRALTHILKLFLPDMIKRKKGRILNVASTAAFMAGPYMSVYYASKAYVLSLSEALASETKGSGVTVSVLCPGPTKTPFQNKAQMKKSDFVTFGTMEASQVALCGYKGMLKGKGVIVPGALNKIMVRGGRLLPRNILTAMAKSTQKVK